MSGFTSWLSGLFRHAVRGLDDVKKLVEQGINGVWHSFVSVVSPVKTAWGDMVKASLVVGRLLGQIPDDVWRLGSYVVHKALPDVVKWATGELEKVGRKIIAEAAALYKWAAKEIDRLARDLGSLKSWVENTVLKPLLAKVEAAAAWVDGQGARLWDMVSHPEKLAALLAAPLVAALLALLKASAGTVGKWFAASILTAMIAAADWVESVFAAIV